VTLTSSSVEYGWDGLYFMFEYLQNPGDPTGSSASSPLSLNALQGQHNVLLCLEDGSYRAAVHGNRMNPDVTLSIKWHIKETRTPSNIPVESITGDEGNTARFAYALGLFTVKVIHVRKR